jgi:5,10-methylenetetrahydromethanopterin reductase
MQRVALGLLGEPRVAGMAGLSARAEELGYDSIWLTETRFTRDAITTAAAVGLATKSVKVGTGVVNAFTRGAVLTAVTLATLDELTEGRTILGIGPGSPLVLERQGYRFDRPLKRLREYVEVIRLLLTGESVEYEGETVTVRGAKLDFAPVRKEVPIYLGVTGPRALELAGEIADGVLLNGFISAAYTRRAIERIHAGAARANRDPTEIDIASNVMVSMDQDPDRAREAARPLVTTYLATFPNIARESSVPKAVIQTIRDAFLSGHQVEAMSLVTDDMVDEVTCSGTPEECRLSIAERREAGVDMPVFFTLGVSNDALTELASA